MKKLAFSGDLNLLNISYKKTVLRPFEIYNIYIQHWEIILETDIVIKLLNNFICRSRLSIFMFCGRHCI